MADVFVYASHPFDVFQWKYGLSLSDNSDDVPCRSMKHYCTLTFCSVSSSSEMQVLYIHFWLGFAKILSVFTARRYASAVLAVFVCLSVRPSVRLSVCPSVTSRSCTKMAKPRIRLTTPYDSPETLVFRCQKSWRNSHDITPTGAPNRGGVGS